MKFGAREICEVVLKAKSYLEIGKQKFYKDEPVLYFDTLKTSSLEGASETVYAQGGRGNARLIAWDGDKTLTFTMEDALLSKKSFTMLSGAGVVDATESKPIYVHTTSQMLLTEDNCVKDEKTVTISLVDDAGNDVTPDQSLGENQIYVMILDEYGDVEDEPFIATSTEAGKIVITSDDDYKFDPAKFVIGSTTVLVDYYVAYKTGAQQLEITADSFGGNFYLEAETLFRDTNGTDLPAEFIIPNCRIQSNFTLEMAATGDPSTFTFTIDAFPDYTRFDKTKKVMAAIQIIDPSAAKGEEAREQTYTYETIS